MDVRPTTSALLIHLLHDVPPEHVSLGWIITRLHERSFGVAILIIALVGLIPGFSMASAVLLSIPAVQMMLARPGPVLPKVIANRRVRTPRLLALVARLIPVLKRLERIVRPRCRTPFETTKRTIGLIILLMAISMLSPLPFSHVIPILVIILIAFAYLEEDGILLGIGLLAAIISLVITAGALWGTVAAWMALD